jgi:hypothetical protein
MKKKLIIAMIIISAIFLFSMQLCTLIFGNKPTINITYPANGATISDTAITVTGTINDLDGDATKVKVWIEDTSISGWDYDVSSGQFSVNLNLTSLTSGTHTICAQGYDANNNVSDTVTVNFTYNGGGGGSGGSSNLLLNGYFTDSGWFDNNITYSDGDTVGIYLNQPSGDYLPNWKFYITAPAEDAPKIDISLGSVRMYTTYSNSNGSAMGMTQDTSSISDFKTGSGKTIRISFKIDGFENGVGCVSTYFEAPVKINIKSGGSDYTIAAFTTTSGSATGGYLKTNLSAGQTITETFILPTTALNGTTIPGGQQITELKIWCNGWTWNVTIYSIEVY